MEDASSSAKLVRALVLATSNKDTAAAVQQLQAKWKECGIACGRRVRWKKYPLAFTASDAVTWLVQHGALETRAEAVEVLAGLQEKGWILPIYHGKTRFQDGKHMYRFCKVGESPVGNGISRSNQPISDDEYAQFERASVKCRRMGELGDSNSDHQIYSPNASPTKSALRQHQPLCNMRSSPLLSLADHSTSPESGKGPPSVVDRFHGFRRRGSAFTMYESPELGREKGISPSLTRRRAASLDNLCDIPDEPCLERTAKRVDYICPCPALKRILQLIYGVRSTSWKTVLDTGADELRKAMSDNGLVKDRMSRLKLHNKCFVACDALAWMLQTGDLETKEQYLSVMRYLQVKGVIQSARNQRLFCDDASLFRFKSDFSGHCEVLDAEEEMAGQRLYSRVSTAEPPLIRDRVYHGKKYRLCVVGEELVDFLVVSKMFEDRKEAVDFCQKLLVGGFLTHVTRGHRFKDRYLFYRFRNTEEALGSWLSNVSIPDTECSIGARRKRMSAGSVSVDSCWSSSYESSVSDAPWMARLSGMDTTAATEDEEEEDDRAEEEPMYIEPNRLSDFDDEGWEDDKRPSYPSVLAKFPEPVNDEENEEPIYLKLISESATLSNSTCVPAVPSRSTRLE